MQIYTIFSEKPVRKEKKWDYVLLFSSVRLGNFFFTCRLMLNGSSEFPNYHILVLLALLKQVFDIIFRDIVTYRYSAIILQICSFDTYL